MPRSAGNRGWDTGEDRVEELWNGEKERFILPLKIGKGDEGDTGEDRGGGGWWNDEKVSVTSRHGLQL